MNLSSGVLALVLIVFLAGIAVYGTTRYVQVVFDGQLSEETLVEGLHYSIQAITTVGYGGWEPANGTAWKKRPDSDREGRMFQLKRISLGIMVLGALGFGALIAAVSDFLMHTAVDAPAPDC